MRNYQDINKEYEQGYRAGQRAALRENDMSQTTHAVTGEPITMANIMNCLNFEQIRDGGPFEREYGAVSMSTDSNGHPMTLILNDKLKFRPVKSKDYNIQEALNRLDQFSEFLSDAKDNIEYFESKIQGMKKAIMELKTTGGITRRTAASFI